MVKYDIRSPKLGEQLKSDMKAKNLLKVIKEMDFSKSKKDDRFQVKQGGMRYFFQISNIYKNGSRPILYFNFITKQKLSR